MGDVDRSKMMTQVKHWKLEKFNGEYQPGMKPVETLEGGDGLPTVRRNAEGEIIETREENRQCH